MSELTMCSYCTLQKIKGRAKAEGNKVLVVFEEGEKLELPDSDGAQWPSGYKVYAYPKEIDIKKLLRECKYAAEKNYLQGWFREFSKGCVC